MVTILRICSEIRVDWPDPVHLARPTSRCSPWRLQTTRGYPGLRHSTVAADSRNGAQYPPYLSADVRICMNSGRPQAARIRRRMSHSPRCSRLSLTFSLMKRTMRVRVTLYRKDRLESHSHCFWLVNQRDLTGGRGWSERRGAARTGWTSVPVRRPARQPAMKVCDQWARALRAHAADSARYQHQNGLVRALALQGWLPVFADAPLPA